MIPLYVNLPMFMLMGVVHYFSAFSRRPSVISIAGGQEDRSVRGWRSAATRPPEHGIVLVGLLGLTCLRQKRNVAGRIEGSYVASCSGLVEFGSSFSNSELCIR